MMCTTSSHTHVVHERKRTSTSWHVPGIACDHLVWTDVVVISVLLCVSIRGLLSEIPWFCQRTVHCQHLCSAVAEMICAGKSLGTGLGQG